MINGFGRKSLVLTISAVLILPILVVLSQLLTPDREIWSHLLATVLPRMVRNTVVLLVSVGSMSAFLGTALAWLVSAFRFPGRKFFDWALMLPMAIPGYILAFIFIATFDYVGIVQTTYRQLFGARAAFPSIYTGFNASLVMTSTLYPYVYLLMRSAFRNQSAQAFDAARTMGHGPWSAFFRVALPLARPSLVAGTVLVLMETLGEFAAVRFFNYPTLSEGVFRVWEGMMNRAAAMELASLLALFGLTLVILERRTRGKARYTTGGGKTPGVTPRKLTGFKALGATAVCSLVLLGGFFLPLIQLIMWTSREIITNGRGGTLNVAFIRYLSTTAGFAALAAAAVVIIALLISSIKRHAGSSLLVRSGATLASIGYALPGAVIAVGVLIITTNFDGFLRNSGLARTTVLTGSILGLTYAYAVRFMAVGHNSLEAGYAAISQRLDESAKTMGKKPWMITAYIHIPLLFRSLISAATLVFIDVMKELPVTLLIRPFGMDTLALWAYLLASEGFWESAAVPSLVIVLVGLIPVAILVRLSGKGEDVQAAAVIT